MLAHTHAPLASLGRPFLRRSRSTLRANLYGANRRRRCGCRCRRGTGRSVEGRSLGITDQSSHGCFDLSYGPRAGVAIVILILMAVIIDALRMKIGRTALRAALPLAAMVVVLLAWFGPANLKPDARLSNAISEYEGLPIRPELYAATTRMFADRWFSGFGAGTYPAAFPYYRPDTLHPAFFPHAHNDFLELFTEFGIAGMALVFWLAVTLISPLRGKDSTQATLMALGALAVHASIDFPLRTPAVALTVALMLGAVAATRTVSP